MSNNQNGGSGFRMQGVWRLGFTPTDFEIQVLCLGIAIKCGLGITVPRKTIEYGVYGDLIIIYHGHILST